MQLPLYQVDAFASKPFEGNPAAVCPLDAWLDDATLQNIAAENNLSETAFFVPDEHGYHLRWFTPEVEVDLCGHATLASAWVLMHELNYPNDVIHFSTRSGRLSVRRSPHGLEMDFPSRPPQSCAIPDGLLDALGVEAATVLSSDDYIVVVEDENLIPRLAPDLARLKGLPHRGVAVTAPSKTLDFVTRWFGPNVGVSEDPVTGSAHTALAPYWAQRLGKTQLRAQQGGARRGYLHCEVAGDRVLISGNAVVTLRGHLYL